jgi:tetratricopeptide (TPR) repeat protein
VVPREYYEGVIADGLGNAEQARESFLTARERAAARVVARPSEGIAFSVLGQIEARLGNKEEALRQAERGVELYAISGDELQRRSGILRLAAVCSRVGEFDRALDLLEERAKLPNGPTYGLLKLSPIGTRSVQPALRETRRLARAERTATGLRNEPANFFAELKRRNVYKVAAAYGVVAWLLIQLASILFPTFEAPAWVMKVFVALVALGFPLALIFAWAFELTPEGIKRTEDVAPDESITLPDRT